MARSVGINQYSESVGTPGRGIDANVNPLMVPGPNIDLSGWAQGAHNLAVQKEASNQNNARAELAALEPQARLDIQQQYDRIESTWAPGQAPIAEQMGAYIKDYTANVEKNLQNPRTAELVRARASEFQTAYMLKGAEKQLGIERDVRIGQYKQAYEDNAKLGATTPEGLGLSLAKLNASVMADEQIPLVQRQELIKTNSNATAQAVAKVQAEADPRKTLAITGSLLGITTPSLQVPNGNLVDAIVQRESGNRLFDEAGKVLAGPAITTARGETVHAYGKYQLLESTAKAQAEKMGIPWDRELFFRDRTGNAELDAQTAQYHDQLGQGVIADSLERFGDPITAAAAHNMGPEAAAGWAAGRPYQTQSGKWWHPSKPMDLAAMPAETRKYIEGLGAVSEQPPANAQDVGGEYATSFRLLTTEQLLSVYGSAQTNLTAQQRVRDEQVKIDKGFFEQELKDISAAAKSGDDFAMPSDDKFALLGPVQGVLEKQKLLGLKAMAGQLNAQSGMSNAELQAQTLIPDPEGVADRANRQAQTEALRANARAIIAKRDADPGLAASQSPQVQKSALAWQQASADFYNAGASASPEQLSAMNQAQGDYINTSFAVQRQWGIINPKLPKQLAENLGAGFLRMMKDGNVQGAAARMRMLPQQMGGSYDAIEQVAGQTGDVGRFAMEGVPPGTLNTIYQARQLAVDDLNKQLGAIKPKDVNDAVANAFAPLLSSLNAPGPDGSGDATVATRYYSNGVLLAKSYLASGRASGAREAARMAYDDLYANRETIVNGVRIPLTFNPTAVTAGLQTKLRTLTPDQLAPVRAETGFTPEETASRQLRAIQSRGRWVTDETGESAYLMVGGKPVLGPDRTPVRFSYRQAEQTPAIVAQPVGPALIKGAM